jgi:acetyl-CoA C-acetyltransferase
MLANRSTAIERWPPVRAASPVTISHLTLAMPQRAPSTTPIIVGVGQVTQRYAPPVQAKDPLSLIVDAAEMALDDASATGLRGIVDEVAVVNILTWSYADAPGSLAARLGLTPRGTTYTAIGGNTPQALVNRFAASLASGACRAVLLAGGEAGATAAKARHGPDDAPNWPPRESPRSIDGDVRLGVSEIEQQYDLFLPSAMYPLIETAIRARSGRSVTAHREFLGELFARFAGIAATNPLSWFSDAHSPQRIAAPTPDNRYVSYPYTKLMNSIIAVDQAAALVLTTETEATRAGIDRGRWVYPMGGGEFHDVWHVTERPDLARSPAIAAAARRALSQAGCSLEEVAAFDLYSCFPAAVELALDALGIPWDDPRPLTITGGLPYFGGPGNNYSMHAIATAVTQIRRQPTARVLVSALGWYCTKHAVGIYGASRPRLPWSASTDAAVQSAIDRTATAPLQAQAEGSARVEAFVIRHSRDGQPVDGTALVSMAKGSRALASLDVDPAELSALEDSELVGRNGQVRYDPATGRNRLRFG